MMGNLRAKLVTSVIGCCTLLGTTTAFGQAQHGVSIFKQCGDPVCVGESTTCDITVAHADLLGDTTRIVEAFDIVDYISAKNPTGSNIRVPLAGNLPIVLATGNTTCTAGGSLPCLIGPASSTLSGLPGAPQAGVVTFRSEYTIQADDPDPITDQGTVRVQDLCDNPNTTGCSGGISTVQFTASTPITRCDDGDTCTNDSCLGGVCSFDSVCNDPSFSCDDANVCTTDTCNDDSDLQTPCCSNDPIVCPPLPCQRVTGCNAVTGCEYTFDCRELAAPGATCCPDEVGCLVESCNQNTGLCGSEPLCPKGDVCCADGASCDDGNACTEDICEEGCCVNRPISCDDGDACTTDTCDTATGCVYTPIVCDDGDACTTDACVGGICVYTDVVCDDGDACTTDTCEGGKCVYTPIVCDDGDACTTDRCEGGKCIYTETVCDDADACTTDVCKGGKCVYSPVSVDDNNRCTEDTCDPKKGPIHTPIVCDDNNPCTRDTCDPADGKCDYTAIEPPPAECAGGDGCTPGFWRQEHHFPYWIGYSPTDLFDTVFGVTSTFPANTLHEAVLQGGGGEKALGRHAVAALLNSTNGDVDYAFDTATVIQMVQDAYESGDFEGAKNLLATENERGCTVVKDNDDRGGSGNNGNGKGKKGR